MKTTRITNVRAEKFLREAKDKDQLFEANTGLMLRKRQTGPTWYGILGKKRKVVGWYGECSIDQARDRALEFRDTVRTGQWFPTSPASMTLAQLADRYHREFGLKKSPKTQVEEQRYWQQLMDMELPDSPGPLRDAPVDKLTPMVIHEIHQQMGQDTPYAANRMLALLRAALGKAVIMGAAQTNAAAGISKFPEEAYQDYLRIEEFRQVHDELLTLILTKPRPRTIDRRTELHLMTLLWSGCRPTEPLQLQLEDLHEDHFILHRHKGAREGHRTKQVAVFVPGWLPPMLRENIQRSAKCPWVFPGKGWTNRNNKPMGHYPSAKIWKEVIGGFPWSQGRDLPLKSMRHTMRTLAAELGVDPQATERLLRMPNVGNYQHVADQHGRETFAILRKGLEGGEEEATA